jgi:hypothetical protein
MSTPIPTATDPAPPDGLHSKPPVPGELTSGRGSRVALIVAAIAVLVLERFVPFGRLALYPFTLMATWVHEMGHGFAALACGGHFDHLEINADASGLAYTAVIPGWREAVTSAGGLLDPPFVGAIFLATARGPKRAGTLLAILSGLMLLSVLVWVRSSVGIVTVLPLAGLLAACALWAGNARTVIAQLVGVLLALDTVTRIDYLFMTHATIGGVSHPSDVSGVASALGGPTLFWGIAIAAMSFALLAGGLRAAWAKGSAK